MHRSTGSSSECLMVLVVDWATAQRLEKLMAEKEKSMVPPKVKVEQEW